jgi:oligopeptide transport system substrate-binding protein
MRCVRLLLFALVPLLMAAGCRPHGSQTSGPSGTQVLQRGAGVEPGTIDPQRNTGAPEAEIIRALFDSLVQANPDDVNEVIGKGAARWSTSEDGLVYDFHLRPEARWSNGDPVTAEDYRRSILRLLEPALAGNLVDYAYPIVGAEDYHQGRNKDPAKVGVFAVDPHHLQIRLRAPTPHFIYLMEDYPFVAVHQASIEANGGWLNPSSPWTRPGTLVSNGPFRLVRWTPGLELVVERNPYYWNAAQFKLNGVRYHLIDSTETEERAFRAGQLHVTYSFPTTRLATYQANKSPALRLSPRLGSHWLFLNTTKPPLNDPRVRRALAFAIDRQLLSSKVLASGEAPGFTLSQPGMGGYQPDIHSLPGPDEARKLLAEAGFPGGAGFPVLNYLYNTSERNREVAQALQQMWVRELGIRVELHNEEWKVFLDSRRLGHYDVARGGWLPFTPEQSEYFRLCHSASQNNESGWHSAEFDAICNEAEHTMDRRQRHDLYRKLDHLLADAMPMIPLAHYTLVRLVDPVVRNWRDNIRDKQYLEQISIGGAGQTP